MKNESTKQARVLALNNAAAMIEGYGEEGGIEQEDYEVPVEAYLKEAKHVAKILYSMAEKYKKKHNLQ